MAKIKFGAVVQDARGKIDGIVYSKNQFGAYVRQKVSPVNPKTARQTLVRERMTTLSKRFSTIITQAQRDAWNFFGKVNPVVDVFGNPQATTGIIAYTRLNGVILNAGGTIIDTPPADLEVIGLLSLSVLAFSAGVVQAATVASLTANVLTLTATGHTFDVGQILAFSAFTGGLADLNGTNQTIATIVGAVLTFNIVHANVVGPETGTLTTTNQVRIAFTATPLGAAERLYVWASSGKSVGRQFFQADLRWISVSGAAQASPYDASADYVAKFGALVADQVIGLQVSVCDRVKGAVSPGIFARVVVQ